jgi:hypothetical protein
MRFFKAELQPGVLLPPQHEFQDKFGGLPWGLPADRWPVCATCGQPLSLLAQLRHHAERLNLGRDCRILHVFQCADWWNTCCHPFEWGSGSSACFILEPEQMGSGLTPLPARVGNAEDPWAWFGHPTTRVTAWVEREESIPAEHWDAYFGERWWEVPFELREAIDFGPKLGGIPFWGNVGTSDHLPAPWRLAVQFPDYISFPAAMPDDFNQMTDECGTTLIKNAWRSEDGSGWDVQWANFATGVGYVYVNDEADPPSCYFTWQRVI